MAVCRSARRQGSGRTTRQWRRLLHCRSHQSHTGQGPTNSVAHTGAAQRQIRDLPQCQRYTPSIRIPGFSAPISDHAVNPNPGSNLSCDFNLANGNRKRATPPAISTNARFTNSNFGNGLPYVSLVSTRANGTYSMNYRNEPVQLRVNSNKAKPSDERQQTDLAFAFSSTVSRNDPELNGQPKGNDPISRTNANPYTFPPPLIPPNVPGGPQGTDPFTPLIRGYVGDDIQIRTLVGAHLQPHAFAIHGVHWLSQPSYHNSGYRNVQSMGISEHYEMRFKMPSREPAREGDESSTVPVPTISIQPAPGRSD